MNKGISISIDNYDKLIADGEEVVTTAERFKEEINKIYNTVDELKKTWTGKSAEKYATNIESFKEDLYTFQELISGHGSLVNAVGKDYKRLEEEL